MAFNMKKHQYGNYGPDDLDGYKFNEKDKALELYNHKYAGKPVTICYNPDDIDEFYVKEIEEKIMLQNFKELESTGEHHFFIGRIKSIIFFLAIFMVIGFLIWFLIIELPFMVILHNL